MNKFLSAILLAGSLAFFGTGSAYGNHDGGYASEPVQGTVSEGTIAPGDTVIFSGEGFFPGETIDISVDHEPTAPAANGAGAGGGGRLGAFVGGIILPTAVVFTGTTVADADGNFSYPLALEEEGVYTLTAIGRDSGHTVTAMVVVDAPPAGAPVGTTPDPADGGLAIALPGGLADTGLAPATLIWVSMGIGALALGVASVATARRRSGQEA